MRTAAAFVALAVATAHAQTNNNYTFTSELDMVIDPNTVPQTQRGMQAIASVLGATFALSSLKQPCNFHPAIWCQGQTNTCGLLCNNNADSNTCSETDLKWKCTCASNSSMPGIQYYKQTMPFYICAELFSQCITANIGDSRGQDVCSKNINALCAKHDPPKAPVSDSGSGDSSTSSATTTTAPSASGSGDTKVTTTSSRAFAGPTMAPGAFAAAMGLMAYVL
ncbi:hypothetical protein C2857_003422 [Epichloe festucae Fl1]|uniref:DUF7707 domain-containing protein n=1 Tax=Epichloe festucae (strain Fl1) TaxID=877507 RepID=A0A7S9KS42_EPIFF|nr:hypothetical protein C2857_003422 [Epichloe festucae Fl1]